MLRYSSTLRSPLPLIPRILKVWQTSEVERCLRYILPCFSFQFLDVQVLVILQVHKFVNMSDTRSSGER